MSGPRPAGLFLYAKDLARVAAFYETVLGLRRAYAARDLVALESPELQLVVHAMPELLAAAVTITSPPQRRDNAAMKFFFTVPSLAAAEATVPANGGVLFPKTWAGPGFRIRNACDPEGNVFHLREPAT